MSKSLLHLVGGTLVFWLVVVLPARWLWGESAVLFSATAWLLSLLPAAATLAWAHWAFKENPEQRLLAVMGGTVVRMVVVIGVGMGLYFTLPEFQYIRFWVWVIVFYFFTLTLEIVLLARQQPATESMTKS